MQGKTGISRSHLWEAKFREIIRYFAHDLRAWKIAELSGVSRPTINQLFMKLRIRTAQVCNASSPLRERAFPTRCALSGCVWEGSESEK